MQLEGQLLTQHEDGRALCPESLLSDEYKLLWAKAGCWKCVYCACVGGGGLITWRTLAKHRDRPTPWGVWVGRHYWWAQVPSVRWARRMLGTQQCLRGGWAQPRPDSWPQVRMSWIKKDLCKLPRSWAQSTGYFFGDLEHRSGGGGLRLGDPLNRGMWY